MAKLQCVKLYLQHCQPQSRHGGWCKRLDPGVEKQWRLRQSVGNHRPVTNFYASFKSCRVLCLGISYVLRLDFRSINVLC